MNIEQFIDKHIRADVTALVALQSRGWNVKVMYQDVVDGKVSPLRKIFVKAHELSSPFLDYEAAARAAGWNNGPNAWRNVPNDDNYWGHSDVVEKAGNYRAYLDAKECCEGEKIAPHETPIIGHYIVTEWLADKLEAKGERVERDFGGVIVWARKKSKGLDVKEQPQPCEHPFTLYVDGVMSAFADTAAEAWRYSFDRDPALRAIFEAESR